MPNEKPPVGGFKLNRTGSNRGGSQVSQTAARGRNRLAEFTGESLPAILNRSASYAAAVGSKAPERAVYA